jgi:hypothetical protein
MSSKEAMKKIRVCRKKNGLCTRCGKKLPSSYDKVICPTCKTYIKNNKMPHPITCEEHAFILFMKKKTPPTGDFGKKLKKLMLKNIDSPMTLAKSLNVSTKSVDSWLYRNAIPHKFRWGEIANHFNCSIEDLGLCILVMSNTKGVR